ncbi:MAG: hypothetical protein CMD74_00225 [Gammaproteobacteria bacterium]|nr:hypothetical protein [Gammaproteobacteria bacterium]|tara:strand:- start:1390 stop:1881 length:492 start_codon:yes stop_codon:yes gene_type:complete
MSEKNRSKSDQKRQAKKLEEVAEKLTELSPRQLARLKLRENLLEAIQTHQRLRNKEARRRNIQFLAKLMRKDSSQEIKQEIDKITGNSIIAKRDLANLESWREKLLSDNSALGDYINEYPGTKHQTLRQQVITAREAIGTGSEKLASKQLLRYLRRQMEHQEE